MSLSFTTRSQRCDNGTCCEMSAGSFAIVPCTTNVAPIMCEDPEKPTALLANPHPKPPEHSHATLSARISFLQRCYCCVQLSRKGNRDGCYPCKEHVLQHVRLTRLLESSLIHGLPLLAPQALLFSRLFAGNPTPKINANLITRMTSTITMLPLSSHLNSPKPNRPCASSAFQ